MDTFSVFLRRHYLIMHVDSEKEKECNETLNGGSLVAPSAGVPSQSVYRNKVLLLGK